MEMREVRREPLREFFFHSLAVSLAAENKTQKATERREKNVKGERASSPHSFLSLLSFSTHCSPLPPTSTSHTKTLSGRGGSDNALLRDDDDESGKKTTLERTSLTKQMPPSEPLLAECEADAALQEALDSEW